MIHLWCIFYSKKITLLIWSLWSRLYSSLNFLENQVVLYFVLNWKDFSTFFCLLWFLWQVSDLWFLYYNTRIGNFSFILSLRFSIAEEKQRWLLKWCQIGPCSSGCLRGTKKKKKWGKAIKKIKKKNYMYWNNKH